MSRASEPVISSFSSFSFDAVELEDDAIGQDNTKRARQTMAGAAKRVTTEITYVTLGNFPPDQLKGAILNKIAARKPWR